MRTFHSGLIALSGLVFIALVSAATPTLFCKCTCFTNSTIIALNGPPSSSPHSNMLSEREDAKDTKPRRACTDCNRQFCLDNNLPICKGAKEEDVFTTCFQRDSAKDQAVVFIFIFTTGGLLIWAAVRPWVERWLDVAKERQSYMPIANQNDG